MSRELDQRRVPRGGDPPHRRRQAACASRARARSGNWIAAVGMAIAVGFTFLIEEIDQYGLMLAGIASARSSACCSARAVQMTAMPQMVALFNGVGGGAAALIAAAEFHRHAPQAGDLEGETARRDPLLGGDRLGQLLGLARRVREAAGADHRAAARVPPARTSFNAALGGRARRARRVDGHDRERDLARAADARRRGARRAVRAADRRRGHAGRDLAAERLYGARGRLDRIRARQHRADHRRDARRGVGDAPHPEDGPGDGPAARADALRRVRRDGDGRAAAAAHRRTARACARRRRTTSASCSRTHGESCSSRATGSRSRRRSTTCAASASFSRARASTSATRSIPSRAECRGT